ncbi:ATP-binding protein [Paracidobacterium acidisoli]|uniref:histidine kinase n=1 Tax=Paracidobacterium acidisoli TaxID=2303751 RepID=A0A372IJ19_9BACT|nr:ATP-binding protein [Paracidobacterium acidisoli]MBT9333299.1 HAMP domain-containing protein [Paracidobacterium acidisoli]
MRGLFLKIFVIFWIAQSFIFVISTALILSHRYVGPDVFFDTLYHSLRNEALGAADAYDLSGCKSLHFYVETLQQDVQLNDASFQPVCGADGVDAATARTIYAVNPGRITGKQVGNKYVWSVPVTSSKGTRFYFFISRPHRPDHISWYRDLLHFSSPQLPVAIVVCGITTFILVLLLTRPIARLRAAASELALGNLKARVAWPGPKGRIFQEDEIQALVHDFNHMAERLESLVDAQQMLLRDVSHELRSPLARLSVALELAREENQPRMATHLERIEREAARLNSLIGQLLTLSSMESMESSEKPEPFSLNDVIEQVIPDAEYEARQRNCEIRASLECECMIRGNPELIYRAVENIVRNAIRYTEAGCPVDIRLTTESNATGEIALLEIHDNGPGIPEEQLKTIFRPFYRVDHARSRDTGGFGVGLAIADRAVKLHHGELRASNRAEGGAMIQMRLPAASVHACNVVTSHF